MEVAKEITDLYPDLIEQGGLANALRAALREIGSCLPVSELENSVRFVVYGRIESGTRLHLERGGTKGPALEEQVTMDFAFATVVTIAPISAGEPLTRRNLWVKRPGTGSVPAERYDNLLGRIAARDLPADTHITMDDVL